ncbi:hypothetical protein [Sanyastnella coralliicola]|uniref:hypothetical protein n=1 Tax=Sanyastnella coralliicola TaxID=3069118 RepID=UPI0027B9746A|nr:hypothetical protein [Longitalea sp. SCSIO 12813]
MRTRTTLLIISILTFGILACNKDDDNPTGNGGTTPSSASIQNTLLSLVEKETHTINAQFPTTIRTESYAEYTFSQNAFVDQNGNTVIGNVDIRITELFDNSSLFFAGQQTVSDDQFLITGGQFNIEAFQNGQALSPSPSYNLNARIPTDNPDNNMDLFIGEEGDDGLVNWLPATGSDDLGVWEANLDSANCSAVCGSIELEAGDIVTLSYNAGPEDPSLHAGWYEGPNDFGQMAFGNQTTYEIETEVGGSMYLCITDTDWDGWEGASLTITINGVSSTITISSDDCDPVPFSWVYQLNTTHLGWVNCDYFSGGNADSQVIAHASGEFDCGNTVVYSIFVDDEVLGVMSCGGDDNQFTSYQMPSGTNVVVAALSLQDDVYYSSFIEVTVSGDVEVDLDFAPTTISDFENYINGL